MGHTWGTDVGYQDVHPWASTPNQGPRHSSHDSENEPEEESESGC